MNLKQIIPTILLIFINKVTSLYPSDRWFFPVNSHETPENILTDTSDHSLDNVSTMSPSPSSSSEEFIRNSELVRFADYTSILGSPLATLSTTVPPITGDSSSSSLIKRNESEHGTTFLNYSMKKSLKSTEDTIQPMFSLINMHRNHFHAKSKEKARHIIMSHFWKYGLETYAQRFTSSIGLEGVNLIGIWPGKNRNKSGDSILLVGGHYDTVLVTTGIDDNGSGVVALLELVRLIGQSKPWLDHTIFFVAFDLEESRLLGSKAFVSEYLIPNELVGKKANFLGAYIIDMILTWDPTEGSQIFDPDFKKETPEAVAKVRKNKNRGDFASIWMRRGYDKSIWEPLEKSWNRVANSTRNKSKYKLIAFDVDLPKKLPIDKDLRQSAKTFLRSDHSSFWYPGDGTISLNALLITDLGPWRGYQQKCYHKPCDDLSQITRAKLGFVAHVIMTLYDLITVNPPKLGPSPNDKAPPEASANLFPRKWTPTSLNWPMLSRRTPLQGLDGLYSNFNNRGNPDFRQSNWTTGLSDRPIPGPSTWNGNNFFSSWPSARSPSSPPSSPSAYSSSSSSPTSNPLIPSYSVSEFNPRTLTNPWYTLFNRQLNY